MLVDDIVELGFQVAAGLLSRDEAAQQLMERSNGGLTLVGAGSEVDRWRTARQSVPRGLQMRQRGGMRTPHGDGWV